MNRVVTAISASGDRVTGVVTKVGVTAAYAVKYDMDGLRPVHVNPDIGLTFAR